LREAHAGVQDLASRAGKGTTATRAPVRRRAHRAGDYSTGRTASSTSRCRQAARAADGAIAQASLLLRLLSAECGTKRTYRDSLLFVRFRG